MDKRAQGCWKERRAGVVLPVSTNVCVFVNIMLSVCISTGILLSLPAQEEEGVLAAGSCLLKSYGKCYWRKPVAGAACVTGGVNVLFLAACVGVPLADLVAAKST